MTENQARTTANVVMAAAALGAAVLVLRNPKLRRITWRLARHYVAGPLAVWGAAMVKESWERSAAARSAPYELPPASQSAR